MERYRFTDNERALMEKADIPFAIYQFIDKRVVPLILSKGFCDLFGYEDLEKAYYDMANDMYRETHPDDAGRIADAAYRFATADDAGYDVVYRSKAKDGESYNIIHAQAKHIQTDTGVRLAQVWYTYEGVCCGNEASASLLTDSFNTALYKDSSLKASYYDHLTGLPGMTYFFELATYKRKVIELDGGTPAMLYMDFSGMKYYNHKFGFAEGDKLLQAFSRVLAKHFGNENTSRLGQDHFAVITKAEGIETELKSLFEECAAMEDVQTLPVHVGIYKHWFDGIVASMACDRAKFACDTLKNLYSSEFSYYDMKMKDAEERQQYIIANLDKAIEERWIKVYYQPIVRAVNGRVCDEEALARWIDPVMGFMSPGDFIPVLEDHRLIYKLDLFVVECVLQKIKTLSGAGLNLMPQSVNLSRSDFDSCDIVSEICRRVDKAGIDHSMLTIEITESVLGDDFDFMKKQVERFRALGFRVWMDDFGSGYSSLDMLQSMPFDLLKFDMRFMQQFNNGPKSRIMLTELLRMANALGLDTVCEGVETEEQAKFLLEAGCAKLQGYYYQKPIPVEKILEKYALGIQIGFEEPEQSQYYDIVGRLSLHDISSVAQDDNVSLDKYFDAMPMAIIEVKGNGLVRFTRSNSSYREFMHRNFGMQISDNAFNYGETTLDERSPFLKALLSCRNDKDTFMVDEQMGSVIVHSCMRRIAVNPNGIYAVAVAVLSVRDNSKVITYESIARALAADFTSLYYVDLRNDEFVEYSSKRGDDQLDLQRHGEDFFAASRADAEKYLYSEDADEFTVVFTKENVLKKLDERGTFNITYRLILENEPVYMSMKAMPMQHDPDHIIIGVRNVDQQMKQNQMLEQIRRNEAVFSRMMALSGDYICLYTIDPVTEDYVEYSATNMYKDYGLKKRGKDFFKAGRDTCHKVIDNEEDCERFRSQFTKENVMNCVEKDGSFTIKYSITTPDGPMSVVARAAMIREEGGKKLVFGVKKAAVT
ncbi:MAG: EAL domain-containing protein [Ruminococcus sp.]|uniref:bifunctional diguanylate cyclase/phosphodiesterase n=1 Tax=Ruminococcus sp. TaxID=41978 RepID=UPI0025FCEB69|nr:EAL domain-containing protein [Ruminococcus sp.]MBO4866806.1 EAL domain-containing protein [Ruminococcus sp.]